MGHVVMPPAQTDQVRQDIIPTRPAGFDVVNIKAVYTPVPEVEPREADPIPLPRLPDGLRVDDAV